jgi:tetratricopeptide (TPR) repeat protein
VSALLIGCATRSSQPTFTPISKPTSDALASETTPDEAVAPGQPAPTDTKVIEVEPLRIQVIRDDEGNEQVVATDARSLFDEANDALADAKFESALKLYDEIEADFQESALAVPALFNAGLALEGLGRVDDAVERYMRLANAEKTGRDAVDARIRAAALYAENERWSASLKVLDGLLALDGLEAADQVEGMARKGFVLLEAADFSAAETVLTNAITLYEAKKKAGTVFHSDYFRAMAQFYLGDSPRRQFDAIPIRLPESQLNRDVEAKAALVLLASERFGDTIELGNIYWATAAGFRVAEMQKNFWTAIVGAPVPPHLSAQASEMYVQEVHRHSLSLLTKALSYHSKNAQLAGLYKSPTSWSEASARAVVTLTELVGREQAGELVGANDLVESGPEGQGQNGQYMPGRIEL